MKYLSVLLLAVASANAFDARWLHEAERELQLGGGTACAECFDKIDLARDCLRECNQIAHPEDNCCCCCRCDKVDTDDATLRLDGDDGQCDDTVKDNECNNNQGTNCKWELDKDADQNRNKWFNLDDYCDCDRQNAIDKDNEDNCKDTDRRSNDRSLLDFCLADNSGDSIESIADLQDCCDMKNECAKAFTEVQECLVGCINPCLLQSAGAWLDCIRDSGEEGSCSRQECIDGYLNDLPEDLGVDKDPDIFDLENVLKLVERIDEEDLQDCSLLNEFVTATCDVSNDCCDRCGEEIGNTVDCLINDIVVPFAEGFMNLTIPECTIDTERCRAEFRKLEGEGEKVVTTVATETAEKCQRAMEANILTYNMSYATNQFMECIMKNGFTSLPDDAPQGSGAVRVFSTLAALVSLVTALLI